MTYPLLIHKPKQMYMAASEKKKTTAKRTTNIPWRRHTQKLGG